MIFFIFKFSPGEHFFKSQNDEFTKTENAISFLYKNRNSFLNFPQREDYDFEELERKLVKN